MVLKYSRNFAYYVNSKFWRICKGPITWSIFNPGVELSPVYRVEISALSVIQNSIKIKRAITWQYFQPRAELAGLKFQPRGWTQPWVEILSCNRFNPGLKLSWLIRACAVVTIYYKKTKWRPFYFRESMPRTYSIAFQHRGWNRPNNRKKFQPR
jgi:hypothetical protein